MNKRKAEQLAEQMVLLEVSWASQLTAIPAHYGVRKKGVREKRA